MLLLFGVRTSDRQVDTRVMTCDVCGYQAAQAIVRRSTRFTLFFVPLFPVRRARYHPVCGHCAAARPLQDGYARV